MAALRMHPNPELAVITEEINILRSILRVATVHLENLEASVDSASLQDAHGIADVRSVAPARPAKQCWATDPRTVTRPCLPPYLVRDISYYYSHEMAVYFFEAVLQRVDPFHRCQRLCTNCGIRQCVLRRHHPAPSTGQHVCIPCLGETAVVMLQWARDREEAWVQHLRENFVFEPFDASTAS